MPFLNARGLLTVRHLKRNTLILTLSYTLLVSGFALWRYHEITVVHQAAALDGDPFALYDTALRDLALFAIVALALVGGFAFALWVLLARRSQEVAELLEGALAGQRLPVPKVKDAFSVAFAAADRVGQELHFERERGAQARERLNALSLLRDVGVLLVDSAGRFDFANARACELLGGGDQSALEARWPAVRELFAPAFESRAERTMQLDVAGGGGLHPLRCWVYPLSQHEHPGLLLLLRDRAALDALETDLLFASQLRALSRVYGAVTHDLKAPLNAMVLNLDRLQSALRKGEPTDEREKTQGYVDVLHQELERLDRSLSALLAETMPAGSGREVFDVRATLQEIERLLRPQARLQHVALEAHMPGVAVRIAGQRDRLKQAILNLALNALDALSEGGRMQLRLEALPDQAEVVIADDGAGIADDVRPRIFDMHYTTKTSGTGIGLYVARSIVEAHGGEIQVQSAPGRGSEFRVRLPTLGLSE